MRLYTVQPRFVYDMLRSEGRFLSQPHKAGDEWLFADDPTSQLAYAWLCEEMQSRGLARPRSDVFPVWAWQYFDGPAKAKPDLRSSIMKIEGKDCRSILFSLDVPDEQVLLHDFHAWHYPLNYLYVGTQKASDAFERRCKKAGSPLFDKVPLKDRQLRAEIEQTWTVIFDLAAARKRFRISKAEQQVQATFWELRAEHVVGAVEFGLSQPKRTLPLPANYCFPNAPR
jgi:hypothetical protein